MKNSRRDLLPTKAVLLRLCGESHPPLAELLREAGPLRNEGDKDARTRATGAENQFGLITKAD
jgi:hypothetical protein